jgi:PPOX class probable F420-dependent enzyme
MSRRDQIRLSDDEIKDFLAASKTAILVSNGRDGFPHTMPMWFSVADDGAIQMTTFGKSQKVKNLQRDPRCTLLVESGEEYAELKGVVIYGEAEIIEDRERIIDTLIAAAGGAGADDPAIREGMKKSAAKRALLRVVPDRIVSWDHSKLAGVY